jgi:hypothetical protein
MFAIIACRNEGMVLPGVANSKEYFPLEVGRFIEYQVDSIVLDDAPGGNQKDTVSFQMREEIVSLTVSPSGDTSYYIHRSRRANAMQSWILTDVWAAAFDENSANRIEENLIFRKMTMPLYKGLRWIATAYINPETKVQIGTEFLEPYENWESVVKSIDVGGSVGMFMFPAGNMMEVTQVNSDDELMKRFVHETYVRDIGMVARMDTILDSRCIDLGDFGPCIGKAWVDHASKGYIISQVMIAHN